MTSHPLPDLLEAIAGAIDPDSDDLGLRDVAASVASDLRDGRPVTPADREELGRKLNRADLYDLADRVAAL